MKFNRRTVLIEVMKTEAAVLSKIGGPENLSVQEHQIEKEPDSILVRIIQAGVNPVDYNLMSGNIIYSVRPLPHVPGSEAVGVAEESGRNVRKGDRVIIYPRIFDGTCRNCEKGMEEICVKAGLFGVNSNGAYARHVYVRESNLFVVNHLETDVSGAMPVGGLTAYHALRRMSPHEGESVLVYGASGNTGIWAIQIAKAMGLMVFAVSGKKWLSEYGLEGVYPMESIPPDLKVDMVINSLGSEIFEDSFSHMVKGGRLTTFGVYTGKKTQLDISAIYNNEFAVIGSTGGSRSDMSALINMASKNKFRIPVERRFELRKIREAMEAFKKKSTGRIVIEPSQA